MNRLFLLFAFSFSLLACSNETEEREIDQGKDYYPVEKSNEWVYAYDSIVYNRQFNTIDTFSGFIKEVIIDELDTEGEYPVYRLERFLRKSLSDSWKINTVWSVTVEENRLIRTEENLPFVKLLFPPKLDVEWDGNAFIDESLEVEIQGDPIQLYFNWDYSIDNKLDQMTVDGVVYQDVLTVVEVNTDDGFSRRLVQSHYARGVGLIAKNVEILECSNCDSSLPWSVKGDKGFTHELRLISN